VISAHRDTHFAPLQRIVRGDQIVVHDTASRSFAYEVVDLQVTDRTPSLAVEPGSETLVLSTCYPFKSVAAGGDLRFVVIAVRRAGESPALVANTNRS
jgi:sortase A